MGLNAIKCLGASVLLASAGAASAVTISFGGCAAADGSVLTTCNASATVVNFNSTPLGGLPAGYVGSLGGGQVVQGSVSGAYAAPAGDTSPYLTIPTQGAPGVVTATPGGTHNYFGLYWGSMDSYNTLTFFNGATQLAAFSGNDIWDDPNIGNANGARTWGYRIYYDFGGANVTSIAFESTQNAFEFDGLGGTVGVVPEPATWAMMIMGFGAAGAMLRRRRTAIA